jgi:FtsH-binding integral membrane protein
MEVQDLEKIVEQQSSTNRMERDLAKSGAFPALMRKVYLWMTMALVITGLCAWGTATSPAMVQLVFGNRAAIWVLLIAELGLVFYTTARIQRLSLGTATTLFIIYSALNGVTLSSIFMVYAMTSIAKVFFITAGTFGVMALYGSVTKTDLSKFGNLFLMALFGLIIATLANLFIKSSGFDLILSYIGVVLFVGLTAWDSQQIKRALAFQPGLDEDSQKVALLGALELYLDFINLFLYLLRIFGRSNN